MRSKNNYVASYCGWCSAIEAGIFDGEFERIYGMAEVANWRANYLEALVSFSEHYGNQGEFVIARCPGQMNIMGMHVDYGGMPSVRLAVRGADTLVVARASEGSMQVRLSSRLRCAGEPEGRFEPIEIDLSSILPVERVNDRQDLMDYAGEVCRQRLQKTGSALADDWSVLVGGQLVYLESYFRDRVALGGFDALVWSSVSPSGGMSSSSALVVATAVAAMGVHGQVPGSDMSEEDLVDGLGTSEWIRGTRGGTADHGGMVLGRSGKLVSVGVFPACAQGEAVLPADYAAVVLDSGIVRQYDEAVKEETVIAYPLGAFIARELILPKLQGTPLCAGLRDDFRDRIRFIRDITAENLGLSPSAIYRVLARMPKRTNLAELRAEAKKAGIEDRFDEMCQREIVGKFQLMAEDVPLYLRRRCVYGLAEQDRVGGMLEYLNAGDMATALELIRISHDGDLDTEVEDDVLTELGARAANGEDRAQLRFLPGGYGRMTPEYDRLVQVVNDFLSAAGAEAGAVQRLGAGWGGNIGGLVRREFVEGAQREAFAQLLRAELGGVPEMTVAVPGEGAGLLTSPAGG